MRFTRLAVLTGLIVLLGAVPATALNGSEANIEGVDYTTPATNGGDEYRFFVSIYGDQENNTKYVDWWQIETLGGDLLGRQDLADNNSDRFQVEASFSLPGRPDYVVVRAHDSKYGYGGQASIIEFEADQERVEQGPEPDDFSDYAGTSSSDGSGGGGDGGGGDGSGGGGALPAPGNDTDTNRSTDGNGTADDDPVGGVGPGSGPQWGTFLLGPVDTIVDTVEQHPDRSMVVLLLAGVLAAATWYVRRD